MAVIARSRVAARPLVARTEMGLDLVRRHKSDDTSPIICAMPCMHMDANHDDR